MVLKLSGAMMLKVNGTSFEEQGSRKALSWNVKDQLLGEGQWHLGMPLQQGSSCPGMQHGPQLAGSLSCQPEKMHPSAVLATSISPRETQVLWPCPAALQLVLPDSQSDLLVNSNVSFRLVGVLHYPKFFSMTHSAL